MDEVNPQYSKYQVYLNGFFICIQFAYRMHLNPQLEPTPQKNNTRKLKVEGKLELEK